MSTKVAVSGIKALEALDLDIMFPIWDDGDDDDQDVGYWSFGPVQLDGDVQ